MSQFQNLLSNIAAGPTGRRQNRQIAANNAQMAQLNPQLAQAELERRQLANRKAAAALKQGPGQKFSEPYRGGDGQFYQYEVDPRSGRVIGSVLAGSATPSGATASTGGAMPSFVGPAQKKKELTGLAAEASLYLPDGVEWADATNEQKKAAHQQLVGAKREPNDPSGLRKEYRSVTNDFAKVNDAWGRIVASAENPSAAGDLALIFNYMKVLDPGSTVREGEFATAQNSAGVPSQLRAKYNQVISGERLAPEQRGDFVRRGQQLYQKALDGYDQTVSEFQRLSQTGGFNPEMVIFDRATGRNYQVPEMSAPPGEAPPDVDPALWAVMTDEEKAAWQ